MTGTLGRRVIGTTTPAGRQMLHGDPVNARHSLWPERWPAIALQSCIDTIEAAPTSEQEEVRRMLPCASCPEKTRCLNAKRKEIGPLLYDREIQTKPRASESSLFPRSLFAPLLDPAAECLPHYHKPFGIEERFVVVSGWDMAWSEKTGGDWLVKWTAVGDRRTGRKRCLDIQRWQGLRYTEQCALIAQQHALYNDDLVVLEGDAAQVIWRQSLEDTTNVPVISHNASGAKRDLRVGVPGLLIDLANRRWLFPYREHGRGYDEVDNFLDECEAFGWTDDKLEGNGEHDDTVMAWWHCWWGLNLMLGGVGEEHHWGVQDGRA
jgi:hypothetical protein